MPRAPLLPAFEAEVDAVTAEEARTAGRAMLPLFLCALYLVRVVLGITGRQPAVRVALIVEAALMFGRWGVLTLLAPSSGERAVRTSAWREVAYTGSAWLVSAGLANVYFAAAPSLSPVQLLELAIIATAVSGLAMLSMASRLLGYVGYVVINLGSLTVVLALHARADTITPLLTVLFLIALVLTALKTNRALRRSLLLAVQLRESALRDALTGLRNRAFVSSFAARRARQIARWTQRRALATARPPVLAFLLVDLDHFKSVNDTHGHAGGDEVLAAFARIAQSSVRAEDVVARWGGEEFLIVMEVPDRASAHVVAERMRNALASRSIPLTGGGSVDVTCSIGACVFPASAAEPDALTWQETLELADGALYRAKHGGRNRTTWAGAEAERDPRAALEAMRASAKGRDAPERAAQPATRGSFVGRAAA